MTSMETEKAGYSIEILQDKGRGLVARRPYSVGERILLESPLVVAQYSWNKLYGYAACDHCLRPLETLEENLTRLLKRRPDAQLAALPDHDRLSEIDRSSHVLCSDGCETKYCSDACREEARERYHRSLCFVAKHETTNPLMKLDALWRPMHYPPETTSILLIVRLMATLKSTSDTPHKRSLLEALGTLKADAVDHERGLMHKILRDDFQAQLNALVDVLAVDFQFLQPVVDPQLVTVEWLTKAFTMIGLNGQGVGGSAFNRYVTNFQKENQGKEAACDNGCATSSSTSPADLAIDELYEQLDEAVGLEFLNSEGSGLYAVQSACNHSCAPNAKIEFPYNNAVLSLIAAKDIADGEEITISYLDECQLSRSRHSRRRALMEEYLFACECPKCQKDAWDGQPDVTSDEEEDDDEEDEGDEGMEEQ